MTQNCKRNYGSILAMKNYRIYHDGGGEYRVSDDVSNCEPLVNVLSLFGYLFPVGIVKISDIAPKILENYDVSNPVVAHSIVTLLEISS
jgi:hypothetical protein